MFFPKNRLSTQIQEIMSCYLDHFWPVERSGRRNFGIRLPLRHGGSHEFSSKKKLKRLFSKPTFIILNYNFSFFQIKISSRLLLSQWSVDRLICDFLSLYKSHKRFCFILNVKKIFFSSKFFHRSFEISKF